MSSQHSLTHAHTSWVGLVGVVWKYRVAGGQWVRESSLGLQNVLCIRHSAQWVRSEETAVRGNQAQGGCHQGLGCLLKVPVVPRIAC